MTLFNNLSPYGATAVRLEQEEKKLREEDEEDGNDQRQANRFFSSVTRTGSKER